jgi:hypothetical protein
MVSGQFAGQPGISFRSTARPNSGALSAACTHRPLREVEVLTLDNEHHVQHVSRALLAMPRGMSQ